MLIFDQDPGRRTVTFPFCEARPEEQNSHSQAGEHPRGRQVRDLQELRGVFAFKSKFGVLPSPPPPPRGLPWSLGKNACVC